MEELKQAVREALQSDAPIRRELVRHWIRTASHVEEDALLYRLTDQAWNRIEPRLGSDETCALIQRYLLACIREDPSDGLGLTRYEAAGELERWFDHLAQRRDTREVLRAVVAAVTELFLVADSDVRDAIETAFLEHVLEQESLRPWFAHWEHDPRLRTAWHAALAWGEAHPNFVKSLRDQIRAAQSDGE